jgi:GR25 family glycosyltransferase involved in LPS biosynthesis
MKNNLKSLYYLLLPGARKRKARKNLQKSLKFDLRSKGKVQVCILTTRHCLFIASAISNALKRVDIKSNIIFDRPRRGYAIVPHIVIAPQMFKVLPDQYVAFQVEQTVNSRWLTPQYLDSLQNAFAVFDYSLTNIRYFTEQGISPSKMYYQPIGPAAIKFNKKNLVAEPDYDVVFYGDPGNERRQLFLTELKKHFRIKIASEVYGDELYEILDNAKVVVNIHYYENALLETTRIWECLSLNKCVVSERSSDMDEHSELYKMVDFVDTGDVQGMIERVFYWLDNGRQQTLHNEDNRKRLEENLNQFEYYFYRFLVATENISFTDFWNLVGDKYKLETDMLCLHLPEYTKRADDFLQGDTHGFTFFSGLRHRLPWVGCALSYKYMMMLAKKHQFPKITICEDDVEFFPDFGEEWSLIQKYLSSDFTDWDVFSGVMTDLHKEARILAADRYNKRQYVITDRLISMVFNIYKKNIYDTIIAWDEMDHDHDTNTIDRYLERHTKLKVATSSPFLVGHKEELHSTIWNFQNTQYNDLISCSINLLQQKIAEFERSPNHEVCIKHAPPLTNSVEPSPF